MKPFDPRLLRVLPRARGAVAVLAGTAVAGGALAIGQAFAIAALVVAVAGRHDLTPALLGLAAVYGLRLLAGPFEQWYAARAGARVSTGLREALVGAWSARTADDRPDPARALTLATAGTSAVEPYVARYLPALWSAAALPTLAIGTLVVVDWVSAVICVLTVPLLPFFAALIGKATQDATKARWRTHAALGGHFLDVVKGLPTLVAWGRAEHQTRTIRRVSLAHRDTSLATLRIAFLSAAALELLATISVAIVAVACGVRLANGSMPLGTALVAILLAPEAYWPIRRVGAEYHNAADGAQALTDILAELDRPAPAGMPVAAPVALRRAGYRYPGTDREVLTGVDLTPSPGLTVITGPSGAGKTTLLELLAGTRRPTSGEAVPLPSALAYPTDDGSPATPRRVHLVTQRPFLTAATVRDNLLLGVPEVLGDDRLWEALRAVGLAADVAALPRGLHTTLGDDGFGLSAGQRARLAVARALLADADVVLLDEPTAHLDPASADLVHAALAGLAADRPVIAVSHRPELLALADHHLAVSS